MLSHQKDTSLKVSIIIAVYNAEKYLQGAIESVINQTYKNIELIIIDGKSKDKSVNIIQKYSSRIAYWVSEPDKGIYDAWNKGISKATGDWIAFIGSDDLLLPEAIEYYVQCISENKLYDHDYLSSNVQLVTENLTPLRLIGEKWSWSKFKVYMNVAHVGSLHSANYFKRYGNFDTSYRIAADYEMLLRARGSLRAAYLNKTTAIMRAGGVSLNNTKVFSETYQAKRFTGGRSHLACYMDMIWAKTKFKIKNIY